MGLAQPFVVARSGKKQWPLSVAKDRVQQSTSPFSRNFIIPYNKDSMQGWIPHGSNDGVQWETLCDTTTAISLDFARIAAEHFSGYQQHVRIGQQLGMIITHKHCHTGSYNTYVGGIEQLSLQFRINAQSLEGHATKHLSPYEDYTLVIRAYSGDVETHQIVEAGSIWKTVTLHFPREMFSDLLRISRTLLSPVLQAMTQDKTLQYTEQVVPMTPKQRFIVEDIHSCTLVGGLRALYLEAKYYELLCTVVDHPGMPLGDVPVLSRRDIENLHTAREILTQQFRNPPSLASLASQAGLNRRKLTEGFKFLFGQTVYGYCICLRMDEARRLLSQEDMSVTAVALEIGYKNPGGFTKAFKQYFGFQPRQLSANS